MEEGVLKVAISRPSRVPRSASMHPEAYNRPRILRIENTHIPMSDKRFHQTDLYRDTSDG